MVAGGVRDDAATFQLGEAEDFYQVEEGVVSAAGFESADLLVVFEFEEEVEFGGGYTAVGGVAVG